MKELKSTEALLPLVAIYRWRNAGLMSVDVGPALKHPLLPSREKTHHGTQIIPNKDKPANAMS